MFLVDGIKIQGRARFEYRTRQALEVLSDSPTFVSVKGYLTAIQEARSSGLAAIWGTTTFRVGPRTWQAPLVWYASAIVHDAGHAKLYRENGQRFLGFCYTPIRAWTGAEAERLCLRLQLAPSATWTPAKEYSSTWSRWSSTRRIRKSGFGLGDEGTVRPNQLLHPRAQLLVRRHHRLGRATQGAVDRSGIMVVGPNHRRHRPPVLDRAAG